MAYKVECNKCKTPCWAGNIVDLIDKHLDGNNHLKCNNCGATGAYIYCESKTQSNEGIWERWIKGIIRIDYTDEGNKNYHPYVFLLSHQASDGPIDAMQISYYKDHREKGGVLKHGHGPGGTPVIDLSDFKNISNRLKELKLLAEND